MSENERLKKEIKDLKENIHAVVEENIKKADEIEDLKETKQQLFDQLLAQGKGTAKEGEKILNFFFDWFKPKIIPEKYKIEVEHIHKYIIKIETGFQDGKPSTSGRPIEIILEYPI